jgi:hypothetical protein
MDETQGGYMFPRLLLLLSLLFLRQTSLAEQPGRVKQGAPDSCPVTKASARPFIPPWPYDAEPYPGGSWFGTDRLWIAPPEDGTWTGLGHYTPIDPTFRQKMQWWRQGYDYRTEPQPKLKVTGKRLDAPAPPLMAEASNVAGPKPSMMVGMNFPTLGCWEITGHYEGDELTFVWPSAFSGCPRHLSKFVKHFFVGLDDAIHRVSTTFSQRFPHSYDSAQWGAALNERGQICVFIEATLSCQQRNTMRIHLKARARTASWWVLPLLRCCW